MQKIIDSILKEKIIVIVRGISKDKLLEFAEAVYNGGIRVLECTFDAKGETTDEETAEKIKLLSGHFGDRMLIGAGTVLNEKQVELTKNAGGKFIISPDTNPSIIKKTKSEGLISIPGALTPSEAVVAHNSGADFVKIFPVADFGAKYIKNITAPLSHIRFLAVGGVTAENIKEFLNAGALGVGIGSDIANKKLIEANDFKKIELSAKRYVDVVNG